MVKEKATKKPVRSRFLWPTVGIMVAIAAVDQVLKQLALAWLEPGVPVNLIGEWLRLYLLFNPGAAFSMGQGSTWLFTTIQLAFVVGSLIAAPRMTQRWEATGLALIAGGALGNVMDRLFREPGFWFGHVVDYISVSKFAVFNFADASITVGVVIFVIAVIASERQGGRER